MNNNVILLEYRMVLMDEMIHEINHILNCGYEFKSSYYPRSYESNFRNCVEKFFRLLYAVNKIAFVIARIIASLYTLQYGVVP